MMGDEADGDDAICVLKINTGDAFFTIHQDSTPDNKVSATPISSTITCNARNNNNSFTLSFKQMETDCAY